MSLHDLHHEDGKSSYFPCKLPYKIRGFICERRAVNFIWWIAIPSLNYLKYCKLLYSKFSMSQNKIFINLIEYSVHHKMFSVFVVHTVPKHTPGERVKQTHTPYMHRPNFTAHNATYNFRSFRMTTERQNAYVLVFQFTRDALVSKVNRHHIVYVYFLTSLILHHFLCLIFGSLCVDIRDLRVYVCMCRRLAAAVAFRFVSFVASCMSLAKSARAIHMREPTYIRTHSHFAALKTVQNSSKLSQCTQWQREVWKTKGRLVSISHSARL